MTDRTTLSLSASLEDYLAAIFWLTAREGAARVRDIAKGLRVKASSVTGALQALAQKEYINYRPYEPVTLTREGFEQAAEVVQRRQALREFLTGILGVDEAAAESAACRLEHDIPGRIAQRLVAFNEHVKNLPEAERKWVAAFAEGRPAVTGKTLGLSDGRTTVADLEIGREAVIVAVKARGQTARRLVDMGLGRGALVTVEAVAPMGDPIRVRIRGYRLALRKQDAQGIVVVQG